MARSSPLRRVVRAGGFAAITAGMLPPFLARLSLTRDPSARDRLRDRWVRRWSDALLAPVRRARRHARTDRRKGPGGRGRLIVANHRSTIDIAVLLRTFGGRMVSRADISGWPLVGAAARSVGTIFVDRASAMSGAKTIRTIRDALQAGETVCLFPEGTTFAGDEVRPFHAGAFVAALRSGAEIVPVGIAYERESGAAFVDEPFLAHLGRMSIAEPTRVVARIGEPIVDGKGARGPRAHASARARAGGAGAGRRSARDRGCWRRETRDKPPPTK